MAENESHPPPFRIGLLGHGTVGAAFETLLAARAILSAIERPRVLVRCGTFFQARLGALGVRILSRAALLDSIRGYYHLDRVDREARK